MHKPASLRWRVVTPIHLCVSVSVCKLVCNLYTFANSQLKGKWQLEKIVGLTNAYNLCWMTRQCETLQGACCMQSQPHTRKQWHIARADTNFTWATMTEIQLLCESRTNVQYEIGVPYQQ